MNTEIFRKRDILLRREASLAAMSIGVGLTHIGEYDYTQTGFFHSGMFSLCVGLERVLKLILIDDHRLRNKGKFPPNQILRRHSHKLSDLLQRAEQIADCHGLKIDKELLQDELTERVIRFLTDYATTARYYNLDTITGRPQSGMEPLMRWNKEICTPILARHFRPSKRYKAEMEHVIQSMFPFINVCQTCDDGTPINDVRTGVLESAKIKTKQKYSKYYVYSIVCFVCDIQRELEYKGEFFPYLREFFVLFTNQDRNWILRKKSWNPFPPYRF